MTASSGKVARTRAMWAAAALGGLIFGFGLWVSFRYGAATWSLDPDTSVLLNMAQGMERHGPGFLASWAYTPDNWLLSLLPLAVAAFRIFGETPMVVTVLGWSVFVACVLMTAMLARQLIGGWAGLMLACVLVFANIDALGPAGYLAHPVTHNISMAWGLLALIFAVDAVERLRPVAGLCAAACVFIAMVSDPWAAAAIAAPLVIAAGGLAILRRRTGEGRAAAIVAVATLIASIAAQTRLFGLLGFLPGHHLVPGGVGGLFNNAYWAFSSFALTFNIVPAGDPDMRLVKIVNVAALVGLLAVAVAINVARLRRASAGRQLAVSVAALSILGVGVPFLLGTWNNHVSVGRLFPNLYCLGALLVALAATGTPPSWARGFRPAAMLYGALFVIASLASAPTLWRTTAPVPAQERARSLGEFLAAQDLAYGYGPYWGSHALIMGTTTGGRVTVRPVTFASGVIARRPAETSPFWYDGSDEPQDGRRFLVVVNDGEECPSVQTCVAIATRQFGPPSRVLIHEAATILVWPRPISARIAKWPPS